MKFQKLTIHNIASIEDAVIDFEANPLGDSEVFLITGKTGAGKSTILDAICLALFADTPRLDSTKMQGDTQDGTKSMKIDDPRQLMRRNTGEAFVSLTFVGSDDIHYEAVWSVSRSRKNPTGNIQPKCWELKNLDSGQTLTKDVDIKAGICNAIGLDFDQFCRTTMLAQGEFTRFLNSKDEEKAEILEKITGVDIYSKIGAKVFSITSNKEREWKEAQFIVEGTTTLTDVQIKEKEEAQIALDNQYKELDEKRKIEVEKFEWINGEVKHTQEVEEAEVKLAQVQKIIESEEFKTQETLVNEWDKTIDARGYFMEILDKDKVINEQKENLKNLFEVFKVMSGGWNFALKHKAQIADEIKVIDAFLDSEKEKAVVYENSQAIVGQLDTIANGRKTINGKKEEIAKETKLLNEKYLPTLEKANEAFNKADEELKEQEKEVKKHEEEVTALNLPKLRDNKEVAKDLLGKIKLAKTHIDTLSGTKKKVDEAKQNLAELLDIINKDEKKLSELEQPIHDAKVTMDAKKDLLDKQKDTIDKFAKTLRLKLHIGDTCPVCRQTIKSELPLEDDLAKMVGGLENDYKDSEKIYNDKINEKNKLEAQIKTNKSRYDKDAKAIEKDESVDTAIKKVVEACKACGIESMNDSTLLSLNDLESKTKDELSALESRISEGEKKEKAVKDLRDKLDEKRKDVESLSKKATKAEKDVNDCNGRISTEEELIKAKKSEVETAESKVAELLGQSNWDISWKDSPKEFADALSSAADTYSSKSKKRNNLDTEQKLAESNCINVEKVLNTITTTMPEWNEMQISEAKKVDKLFEKANTLNNDVTTAKTMLNTAKEAFDFNKEKLDTFLSENTSLSIERIELLCKYPTSEIDKAKRNNKDVLDAAVAKKALLEREQKSHEEHLQNKPSMNEEDNLESLNEHIESLEKELQDIGEKKGGINQELLTDQENKKKLGKLIDDAEKKKKEHQKWSRMNQLIGDATGSKFRKIAQSYVLSNLIHSANSYMKTLSDRYTLKVTPGTFVISIEDAYQGYVSRASSTISGGESFLVSLSLALALSDIGQTLSVDTLFIDEGFGTLSGEPLQNAINTLRSLHTKAGRHVGIISHVEELQERIPVQIQVNQEGNNSSSTICIVPHNN